MIETIVEIRIEMYGLMIEKKKNKREQEWIVDDRNDRLDKNRDGSKYMIERMDEMRIGTDW